ncbi:MAG: hypothetical protein RLZZ88_2 [Actinomycetota bacterium]|jgi:hypothetical protein
MGFDPHRKYKATRLDYVVIAGAFSIITALVAWAFFA